MFRPLPAAVAAVLLLSGCVVVPKSSVMTVDDYQYIATEIAGKLRHRLATFPLFSERDSDSAPMIVSIQKVRNLTSDIIPESARWYLMAKVRNALPMATLSRQKNILFTIPAEHVREARKRGNVEGDFASERFPTHVMTATFRSVTRSSGSDRTDLYYCEYELTDLSDGVVVWSDKVDFKRTARGLSWD